MIIENDTAHPIRAICLSHYTGICPGAMRLFRRTWHDVDFDAKTLFILSAKNTEGGDYQSTAEIMGDPRTET